MKSLNWPYRRPLNATLFILFTFLGVEAHATPSPQWTWVGERFAIFKNQDTHLLYDLSFSVPRTKLRLAKFPSSATAQTRISEAAQDLQALAPQLQHGNETPVQMPTEPFHVVPTAWWEQTPWTEDYKARNRELFLKGNVPAREPSLFTLEDIEWKEWQGRRPKLKNHLDKIRSGLEEELETDRLFSRIQFKKNSEGDFEISIDLRGETPRYKPTLMADIANPKRVLKRALLLRALSELQGQILGLIPVPFLGSILSGIINKVVSYRRELFVNHAEMLGEFLHIAQDCAEGMQVHDCDSELNPLAGLTQKERENAIRSLAFQQMSLTAAALKILRPTLRTWYKGRSRARDTADLAVAYLKAHTQPSLLDSMPRFALSPEGYWLLGLNKKWNRRVIEPYRSIRFEDPEHLGKMRFRAEIASWTLDFATRFVPVAGGWIRSIMNFVINKSIRTPQHWESRLMARLELLRDTLSPQWQEHYALLEHQRFNPFEISRTVALPLVHSRKQMLSPH